MEYIDGYNLKQLKELLGNKKLVDTTIKGFIVQLVEGLTHLQEKKIFHRNLKLENIMITKKGELKILNLGSAKKY